MKQMVDLWLLSHGPKMPTVVFVSFFLHLILALFYRWDNSYSPVLTCPDFNLCHLLPPLEVVQQVFISVIVFFSSIISIWLFYITSISLLIFSLFQIYFKSIVLIVEAFL